MERPEGGRQRCVGFIGMVAVYGLRTVEGKTVRAGR